MYSFFAFCHTLWLEVLPRIFWLGKAVGRTHSLCSPSFCCAPLYHYSAEFWAIRCYLCVFSFLFLGYLLFPFSSSTTSPQLSHSLDLSTLHSHLFSRGDFLTPISRSSLSSLTLRPTSYLSFIESVCSTSERLTRVIFLFCAYALQRFVILRGTRSGFLLLPETPLSVLYNFFYLS